MENIDVDKVRVYAAITGAKVDLNTEEYKLFRELINLFILGKKTLTQIRNILRIS